MIKRLRYIVAVCLIICLVLPMPLAALSEMSDIEGHWAEDIIKSTIDKGILTGYPDGTFKPENLMTQAEFFAFVNRSFGFDKTMGNVLPSVSPDEWYASDLAKAKSQGYLDVLEEGMLKPKEPISRQMAGAILGKILRLKPDESAADKYADAEGFASWAKGLAGAFSGHGYMNGYKDNTFRPDANITRAEVSVLLSRVTGELYNMSGTYGDEQLVKVIKGNATVSKPDIILKNMVIEGDLYLTEGIGDGTVTLDRVTVKGMTVISGGRQGVFIKNTLLGKVVLNTLDNIAIYLAVQGSSEVGTVELYSGARLEELDLTGPGFGEVLILAPNSPDFELSGNFDIVRVAADLSRLSVLKGTIRLLESNGKDALITLDKSVTIETLTVNQPAKVTGSCYIKTANINSSDVYIEARPMIVNIAPGLTGVHCSEYIASSSGSGGGGGGGGGGGSGSGGNSGNGGETSVSVTGVDRIVPIIVDNGTIKGNIGLPDSIKVTLSDGRKPDATITWDNGNPPYNPNVAGDYVFTGTLGGLPAGVRIPSDMKASVTVKVKEPAPVEVTVTGVDRIVPIIVDNGTVKGNIGLPGSIKVTLSDGRRPDAGITWDNGNPEYNPNVAGDYVFTGTLGGLPAGVRIPSDMKASVTVTVKEPVPVEVTGVSPIADIQVNYGTAKANIGLPNKAEILLSNNTRKNVDVVWNNGNPVYDGNRSGAYTFSGTLMLPANVTNPYSVKASVRVIVVPQEITVTGVETFSDISVKKGTDITVVEDVYLPKSVEITLSSGEMPAVHINWDNGTPEYNGEEGIYVFSGELVLPKGVTNPQGRKAEVRVVVGKPAPVEVIVAGVDPIEPITVDNGTAKEKLGLPVNIKVTLSDGRTPDASISWDNGSPVYNGTTGEYLFTGILGGLPEGVTNPDNIEAAAAVTVKAPEPVKLSIKSTVQVLRSVAFGTLINDVDLPASVEIILEDDTTGTADVAWNRQESDYAGNIPGTYTMYGSLEGLPENVVNPSNVAAVALITVKEAVPGEVMVTGVDPINPKTVDNGTAKENIGLLDSVTITLSDGRRPDATITWDNGNPEYKPNVAGDYVFTGTLGGLPADVRIPDDMKASSVVTVSKPTVASIASISDINVFLGKDSIVLPKKVTATLNNQNTIEIDVAWDTGEPLYNKYVAGSYEFTGTLSMPEGIENLLDIKAKAVVVVNTPNNKGTTLFEFDSLDGLQESATAKVELDQTNKASGAASIRLTPRAPIRVGGNESYYSVVTGGAALGTMENMEFNIYLPEKGQISYLLVNFYTDNWHNIFYQNGIGDWELNNGWNKIRRTRDDFEFIDSTAQPAAGVMALKSSKNLPPEWQKMKESIDLLNSTIRAQKKPEPAKRGASISADASNSWENITAIEIYVVFDSSKQPSVNIDRIGYNVSGAPKILFTFDDAWLDVITYGEPILGAKGFKATTWANKEAATEYAHEDKDKRLWLMNEAELASIYSSGWDIGNHTVSHYDTIQDPVTMRKEYLDNQQWLIGNGWTTGANHVCYPSGSYSDELIDILQEIGVKTARTTVHGIQPTPVSNIYKLKCVAVGRDTDMNFVKSEIDRAVATGSSLFFMFHRVEPVPEADDNVENYGQIAVSVDNLTDLVEYIDGYVQQNKADVVTVSQWYETYMGVNQ